MLVETLWLPKSGHEADEYEDASGASEPDSFPFRAVVADGATESAFSGEWARTLVGEYLKLGDLVESAARARSLFAPALDGRWYVQAKAAEGAHAALLGMEIDVGEDAAERKAGGGRAGAGDAGVSPAAWRAESVGDCCLFHVRGGSLVRSWPYVDAADFHHRPALISSLDSAVEVEATSGTWVEGDTFVLATDALAAWLLEVGVEVLLGTGDFKRLVARARRGIAAGRAGTGADAATKGADPVTTAADPATTNPATIDADPAAPEPRRGAPQPLRNDDSTAVIIRL